MLRYYTYYSIGGYKDLYLGSNEDNAESTYYLPLLSVLEGNANNDADAKKELESLKDLPPIFQLSDKNKFDLPSGASSLFSHAGYKLLYKHVEGNTHALALRDITCETTDELGRKIPFLMVIIGDTAEDLKKLDVITTYIASYLKDSETAIASFIGYDKDKNGLRFKLADFNSWIERILSDNKSSKIVTADGIICVNGAAGKVALLILPNGTNPSYAVTEQNILSKEINMVEMDKVICKNDTEQIINQLEKLSKELEQTKLSNERMRKIAIAAAVCGFILGALIF